jgi:predicted NBD/HSP70 family sugar kinase
VRVAVDRTYRALSRWIGIVGCRAIFARALAQAQAEEPALARVSLGEWTGPLLVGVDEAERTFDPGRVARGLEVLLDYSLAILGRLIGDDMLPRLVEPTTPNDFDNEATQKQ